mmetsp:Transcript_29139/g.82159  ORF Transcript_29139/g.82159 Transcript_29139/m.82159 type:complete len:251 (-) Transcript_29139:304-1056(-)
MHDDVPGGLQLNAGCKVVEEAVDTGGILPEVALPHAGGGAHVHPASVAPRGGNTNHNVVFEAHKFGCVDSLHLQLLAVLTHILKVFLAKLHDRRIGHRGLHLELQWLQVRMEVLLCLCICMAVAAWLQHPAGLGAFLFCPSKLRETVLGCLTAASPILGRSKPSSGKARRSNRQAMIALPCPCPPPVPSCTAASGSYLFPSEQCAAETPRVPEPGKQQQGAMRGSYAYLWAVGLGPSRKLAGCLGLSRPG